MKWLALIYDPGSDFSDDPPLESDGSREILYEILARIEADGGSRELREPFECSGDHVGFDLLINVVSGVAGSGLVWLGAKLREWVKARGRGASGDANAMAIVALFHLSQRHPDVVADLSTCDVMDPPMPRDQAAEPMKAIYTYRIRCLASQRVFLVEVSSEADLITMNERGRV